MMNGILRASRVCAFAVLFLLLAQAVHAASGWGVYPFAAGSARLSLMFGGATAFHQNYTVLGIGGGYFITDGIEVGLDAESWSGSSPGIEEISPQVRAVFPRSGSVSPYAGVFYRRTFIEGYRGLDTVGARVGLYFLSGRNLYFGAGVAEENHLNCDRTIYASCAEIYPELSLAFIF